MALEIIYKGDCVISSMKVRAPADLYLCIDQNIQLMTGSIFLNGFPIEPMDIQSKKTLTDSSAE